MALSKTYGAQGGIHRADIVTVEADLSRGLYSFSLVGLAGKAVEEARDRVSAAVKNSGFSSPKSKNHKITISLAPADLKKEGPLFDLPIALAYLSAAEEITADMERVVCIGELGLDGTLRGVTGVLSIAQQAAKRGYRELIVPKENAVEAALVSGIIVTPAASLRDVINHLDQERSDSKVIPAQSETTISSTYTDTHTALEDVRGQESAKRGLIIAAAGRHNQLLVGPPGTGKTMLARAFQSLLPPLTHAEALEVTAIHSVAGILPRTISTQPPFRTPHHTASHTSLVGGGTYPKPGEVTLAHKGVLFLDEFPEFDRRSIDALRQPLEDKTVSISRVQGTASFPADFVLVAAMNPHRGSDDGGDYAAAMLETYKHKISGPILDRIDLWLPVPHVSYDVLTQERITKPNETVDARMQIERARERQQERFTGRSIQTNSQMSARDIEECIVLEVAVKELLNESAKRLKLSPRSYHRVIKVARTIADLEASNQIKKQHLLEALQYRVQL